jgi:hypothetical protein
VNEGEIVTAGDALTVGWREVTLRVVDGAALLAAWRGVDDDLVLGPTGAITWYLRTGEVLAGCEVEDRR